MNCRSLPILSALLPRLAKSLKYKKTIGVVLLGGLLWYRRRQANKADTLFGKGSVKKESEAGIKPGQRANIDKEFLRRLIYILRLAMPSLWCRESGTAILLAITLVIRTFMTLLVSHILGKFLRALCVRDWVGVRNVILSFMMITVPTCFLNAILRFLTQALTIHIREKITLKVHELYMQKMNYYRANKVGEGKLEHTDQLIAEDIDLFSDQLSGVYSSILKPVVDFVIFSLQLREWLGNRGPLLMCLWFAFSSWASSLVTPAYGKLRVISQQLEGTFRSLHVRLIQNAEVIAFNGGEIPEKKLIEGALDKINKHENYSRWNQVTSSVIMGYLNKYAASVVGMIVVVIPIFSGERGYDKVSSADIASYYIECSRIMGGQAEAVLALFELQKELGQLAGITLRVYNLIERLRHPEKLSLPTDPENPPVFLANETLTFKNVSIFKPDGTLLVEKLNFSVPKGTRVIVTGENGCGKSSLFRVLRGLWPLSVGTIESPPRDSLDTFYFLSQANFVPIGSLREIIIYPHLVSDMQRREKTDHDLWEVLEWARVSDLQVNGEIITMDHILDWDKVLSPGQKQRISFARLLYHCPKYAVLDECTNGIEPEVEVELYDRCRRLGITVFSISHKIELKNLHDFELHYDGQGGYEWINLHES